MTASRLGVGRDRVTFPLHNVYDNKRTVQVSANRGAGGAGAGSSCKLESVPDVPELTNVGPVYVVACYSGAGTAIDARFSLVMAENPG